MSRNKPVGARRRTDKIPDRLEAAMALPDDVFRKVAAKVLDNAFSPDPVQLTDYYRRMIALDAGLRQERALGALYMAAEQGDPQLLEALWTRGVSGADGSYTVFARRRALNAIRSTRDPGCGKILAGWVRGDPFGFVKVLRVDPLQVADDIKPALALLIAAGGELDQEDVARIARVMELHTGYRHLALDSSHSRMSRRAYAQGWDLEHFISLPMTDIVAADALAGIIRADDAA